MAAKPIRITHWKLSALGSGGKKKRRHRSESNEEFAPDEKRTKALGWRQEPGWMALGLFGWMLALVGGIELVLTIIPAERSAEYEFATAIALVSGLPVPAMGVVLVLASALKRKARRTARLMAIVALVGAVLTLAGLGLFATTIPIALRFIKDPFVRMGIYKAVAKTMTQGTVYIVGMGLIGYHGWKQGRPRTHDAPGDFQDDPS